MVIKFILWIATIFEDKAGSISSKRIGFYWCLWMLSRAVQQPVINEIIIYAIVGLAFGLAGLTLPEWFSQLKNSKTIEKTETTIENK